MNVDFLLDTGFEHPETKIHPDFTGLHFSYNENKNEFLI